ncbi:hypothetical protein [Chryseobacterium luteum]|uniref:hypothetical protein n=1 Tax=Chryseobacterium luteum TaxID=421531 RepID=UPI000550A57D|nr:hypothetical protein [Chryseobacterium luteum]
MIKNKLQYLAGKSKEEILAEMGQDFNYYPAEVWTYILHINWLGRKTVLYLFFENDTAKEFIIKKHYGKIKSIPRQPKNYPV